MMWTKILMTFILIIPKTLTQHDENTRGINLQDSNPPNLDSKLGLPLGGFMATDVARVNAATLHGLQEAQVLALRAQSEIQKQIIENKIRQDLALARARMAAYNPKMLLGQPHLGGRWDRLFPNRNAEQDDAVRDRRDSRSSGGKHRHRDEELFLWSLNNMKNGFVEQEARSAEAPEYRIKIIGDPSFWKEHVIASKDLSVPNYQNYNEENGKDYLKPAFYQSNTNQGQFYKQEVNYGKPSDVKALPQVVNYLSNQENYKKTSREDLQPHAMKYYGTQENYKKPPAEYLQDHSKRSSQHSGQRANHLYMSSQENYKKLSRPTHQNAPSYWGSQVNYKKTQQHRGEPLSYGPQDNDSAGPNNRIGELTNLIEQLVKNLEYIKKHEAETTMNQKYQDHFTPQTQSNPNFNYGQQTSENSGYSKEPQSIQSNEPYHEIQNNNNLPSQNDFIYHQNNPADSFNNAPSYAQQNDHFGSINHNEKPQDLELNKDVQTHNQLPGHNEINYSQSISYPTDAEQENQHESIDYEKPEVFLPNNQFSDQYEDTMNEFLVHQLDDPQSPVVHSLVKEIQDEISQNWNSNNPQENIESNYYDQSDFQEQSPSTYKPIEQPSPELKIEDINYKMQDETAPVYNTANPSKPSESLPSVKIEEQGSNYKLQEEIAPSYKIEDQQYESHGFNKAESNSCDHQQSGTYDKADLKIEDQESNHQLHAEIAPVYKVEDQQNGNQHFKSEAIEEYQQQTDVEPIKTYKQENYSNLKDEDQESNVKDQQNGSQDFKIEGSNSCGKIEEYQGSNDEKTYQQQTSEIYKQEDISEYKIDDQVEINKLQQGENNEEQQNGANSNNYQHSAGCEEHDQNKQIVYPEQHEENVATHGQNEESNKQQDEDGNQNYQQHSIDQISKNYVQNENSETSQVKIESEGNNYQQHEENVPAYGDQQSNGQLEEHQGENGDKNLIDQSESEHKQLKIENEGSNYEQHEKHLQQITNHDCKEGETHKQIENKNENYQHSVDLSNKVYEQQSNDQETRPQLKTEDQEGNVYKFENQQSSNEDIDENYDFPQQQSNHGQTEEDNEYLPEYVIEENQHSQLTHQNQADDQIQHLDHDESHDAHQDQTDHQVIEDNQHSEIEKNYDTNQDQVNHQHHCPEDLEHEDSYDTHQDKPNHQSKEQLEENYDSHKTQAEHQQNGEDNQTTVQYMIEENHHLEHEESCDTHQGQADHNSTAEIEANEHSQVEENYDTHPDQADHQHPYKNQLEVEENPEESYDAHQDQSNHQHSQQDGEEDSMAQYVLDDNQYSEQEEGYDVHEDTPQATYENKENDEKDEKKCDHQQQQQQIEEGDQNKGQHVIEEKFDHQYKSEENVKDGQSPNQYMIDSLQNQENDIDSKNSYDNFDEYGKNYNQEAEKKYEHVDQQKYNQGSPKKLYIFDMKNHVHNVDEAENKQNEFKETSPNQQSNVYESFDNKDKADNIPSSSLQYEVQETSNNQQNNHHQTNGYLPSSKVDGTPNNQQNEDCNLAEGTSINYDHEQNKEELTGHHQDAFKQYENGPGTYESTGYPNYEQHSGGMKYEYDGEVSHVEHVPSFKGMKEESYSAKGEKPMDFESSNVQTLNSYVKENGIKDDVLSAKVPEKTNYELEKNNSKETHEAVKYEENINLDNSTKSYEENENNNGKTKDGTNNKSRKNNNATQEDNENGHVKSKTRKDDKGIEENGKTSEEIDQNDEKVNQKLFRTNEDDFKSYADMKNYLEEIVKIIETSKKSDEEMKKINEIGEKLINHEKDKQIKNQTRQITNEHSNGESNFLDYNEEMKKAFGSKGGKELYGSEHAEMEQKYKTFEVNKEENAQKEHQNNKQQYETLNKNNLPSSNEDEKSKLDADHKTDSEIIHALNYGKSDKKYETYQVPNLASFDKEGNALNFEEKHQTYVPEGHISHEDHPAQEYNEQNENEIKNYQIQDSVYHDEQKEDKSVSYQNKYEHNDHPQHIETTKFTQFDENEKDHQPMSQVEQLVHYGKNLEDHEANVHYQLKEEEMDGKPDKDMQIYEEHQQNEQYDALKTYEDSNQQTFENYDDYDAEDSEFEEFKTNSQEEGIQIYQPIEYEETEYGEEESDDHEMGEFNELGTDDMELQTHHAGEYFKNNEAHQKEHETEGKFDDYQITNYGIKETDTFNGSNLWKNEEAEPIIHKVEYGIEGQNTKQTNEQELHPNFVEDQHNIQDESEQYNKNVKYLRNSEKSNFPNTANSFGGGYSEHQNHQQASHVYDQTQQFHNFPYNNFLRTPLALRFLNPSVAEDNYCPEHRAADPHFKWWHPKPLHEFRKLHEPERRPLQIIINNQQNALSNTGHTQIAQTNGPGDTNQASSHAAAQQRVASPYIIHTPRNRYFNHLVRSKTESQMEQFNREKRSLPLITSFQEEEKYLKKLQDEKFERFYRNIFSTEPISSVEKRSLPLTAVVVNPNAKLDMGKTIENVGTIARNSFEDKRAPMYHVRNAIGSTKNAILSTFKTIPQDLVIPSQYKIVDTTKDVVLKADHYKELKAKADAAGDGFVEKPKPKPRNSFLETLSKLRNNKPRVEPRVGEANPVNEDPILQTFQRVGGIFKDCIKSGQETVQHINDVAHSARKAISTAQLAAPRVLMKYSKAPVLQKPEPSKLMLIAPRFLDVSDDETEQPGADQFVGVGDLMNAYGVSNPENERVGLTKFVIEKSQPLPIFRSRFGEDIVGEEPPAKYYITSEDLDDDFIDDVKIPKSWKTVEGVQNVLGVDSIKGFLAAIQNDIDVLKTEKQNRESVPSIGTRFNTEEEGEEDMPISRSEENAREQTPILGSRINAYEEDQKVQSSESQENEIVPIREGRAGNNDDELDTFLRNLFKKNEEVPSAKLKDSYIPILGAGLNLPENLLKPFMNQPTRSELNKFFRANGDVEEIAGRDATIETQRKNPLMNLPTYQDVNKFFKIGTDDSKSRTSASNSFLKFPSYQEFNKLFREPILGNNPLSRLAKLRKASVNLKTEPRNNNTDSLLTHSNNSNRYEETNLLGSYNERSSEDSTILGTPEAEENQRFSMEMDEKLMKPYMGKHKLVHYGYYDEDYGQPYNAYHERPEFDDFLPEYGQHVGYYDVQDGYNNV